MATQSSQTPLVQQPPIHHFPRQNQYPHGYNFHTGGHPYTSGPMNHSDSMVDPRIRIAVLEKELEHYQTGKAEAEIAVQYLASLNAKGIANGANGAIEDKQITKLKAQLAQAGKEKEAFEAKLENALAIITTMLTSKTMTSVLNPPSKSNKFETGPAPGALVQDDDLIDLVDAPKGLCGSGTSGNDATLVNQSYDDFSELADEAQNPVQAKHLPDLELTDGEKEPYIHHFLPNVQDVPIRGDGFVRAAFQVPTFDARGSGHPKKSNASPDQRSETSVEPETDVSSHEHATSSDGPVSLSTSFATANSQINDAQVLPAEIGTNKALEARTLGVQRWNVAASATSFEDVEASGLVIHCNEDVWSSKKDKKSPVAKSPQGPRRDKPSLQVCKLEDEVEVGPDVRDCIPDLLKYGVRFKPDPSERNIYRTILVQGLSSDTTMHQLLQRIRGGKVVDAKLLETSKLIGSISALIVFLHEHAAMAYEEYARSSPLTINNQLVSVKVLNSPTFPTRTGLKKAIEDLQHTRCLEIHNFPRHVSESQLRLDLRVSAHMKGDRVEHLKMRKDRILELHFPSIDYAGQGFGMFTTYRRYKGCKALFVPDPCAQPLETFVRRSTCGTGIKAACYELESRAIEGSDGLSKIEPESEPELRRGRGLEEER